MRTKQKCTYSHNVLSNKDGFERCLLDLLLSQSRTKKSRGNNEFNSRQTDAYIDGESEQATERLTQRLTLTNLRGKHYFPVQSRQFYNLGAINFILLSLSVISIRLYVKFSLPLYFNGRVFFTERPALFTMFFIFGQTKQQVNITKNFPS